MRWRSYRASDCRNRGDTLSLPGSCAPVARLRPIGQAGRVELRYWSLRKERRANPRPFGRTILPLDEGLRFVASEDIFLAAR